MPVCQLISPVPDIRFRKHESRLTPASAPPTLPAMKHIAFLAAVVLSIMTSALADQHEKHEHPYRHVVCFKFKDDASKDQIAAIEKAFGELPGKIDTITGYEWGTNVSPEGLADGFTHCFIVSFKDKAGLEAYIPHEAHQAFVAKLKPILDKVFVIDFVAK